MNCRWSTLARIIFVVTLLQSAIAPPELLAKVGCVLVNDENNTTGDTSIYSEFFTGPVCACSVVSRSEGSSGEPSLSAGGSSGSSCGSCGGGTGSIGPTEDLREISAFDVYRIWLPADQSPNSSFTPGFFSQFDSQIQIHPVSGGASIDFFSALTEKSFHFVDGLDGDTQDGIFRDLKYQSSRSSKCSIPITQLRRTQRMR